MPDSVASQARQRTIRTNVMFWVYAVVLLVASRWLSHHFFRGWVARVATMGGVALGLLPWTSWLRPRVRHVADGLSRNVLIVCYWILLAPMAILARFFADPLRRRPSTGHSQWVRRPPLPNTLEASQKEY